jgi:hypothetical protein
MTIFEISAICGSLTTISGLVLLFVKPIREWFKVRVLKISQTNELSQQLNDIKDMLKSHIEDDKEKQKIANLTAQGLRDLLRKEMVGTYYKYLCKVLLFNYNVPCFRYSY